MVPSQPRLDVGKCKDERVAEEFAINLSGDLGSLGVFGDPKEFWSAFKTTILDAAAGCLGTHHQAKRSFISQGFREMRCKTVCSLRADKEAYVRGICEGVEHHVWSSDSYLANREICELHSFKPVLWCAAVRVEGGELLTEESEVRPAGPITLSGCTRLMRQLSRCLSGVLLSLLLTLQSTVINLHLWKHRLR